MWKKKTILLFVLMIVFSFSSIAFSNSSIIQNVRQYVLTNNEVVKGIQNVWLILLGYIVLSVIIFFFVSEVVKPITAFSIATLLPLLIILTYITVKIILLNP